MGDPAERVAALSPAKLALFQRWLTHQRPRRAPGDEIVPHGAEETVFPLSFAQERLWFLDQLAPGSPFYNLTVAYPLHGPIAPAVLSRCLDEVVRRHEVLRATFRTIGGEAVQVVAPSLRIPLAVKDLRPLPPERAGAEVRQWMTREARTPFDLRSGPLLRATLLLRVDAEHLLVLSMHHIISDGWSLGVLLREISALYQAFAVGRASPLPELPCQYADFARWQRRRLRGKVLDSLLAYWKHRLAGIPALLDLPTDRPRPAAQTFNGSTLRFSLPPQLATGLQALCRAQGATLFMGLLALFQTLLHRYSGQQDFTVGAPMANRSRAELEKLIGFFVNTLVLRCDLSADPDFTALLARVRATALGAFAHQDLPFERLVGELQPRRDLSRHPLFQVVFALQNDPLAGPAGNAGDASAAAPPPVPWDADTGTAKFDLSLSMAESPATLFADVEYNSDLFDRARIARLVGHLQALLASILAEPQRPLSLQPLLTPAERQQLLEWNDTGAAGGPRPACFGELFAEQAVRTPEAPAVVCGDDTLSYAELAQRAARMARRLRQMGVGPEARVGICAERSAALIGAVLGVLEAGGAYVPLDPAYPRERLAWMIHDVRPLALLVGAGLEELPFAGEPRAMLVLEEEWAAAAERAADETGDGTGGEPAGFTPENLAYLIYTSGSTGRPKAVMVPHRGLGNLAEVARRTFEIGPASRVLQFSSLSFDAFVIELLMTLLSGATFHLADHDSLLPGPPLQNLINERGITHAILPPSAAALLDPDRLPLLSHLILAGEACPDDLMRRWCRGRTGFNAYGPSEATVAASIAGPASPLSSIGRPFDEVRVHLLDAYLTPVGIGVPGELCIGGIGVARGYLERPELTADRFIPDPLSGEAGARLYRSGDLARFRPDGHLEFLGRLDHQVKVRGFRIELGEIESALRGHPAVAQAVVVAAARPGVGEAETGSAADRSLVAYCVPAAGWTAPELRSYLLERLPEYMVPAAFVPLAELPLSPNGKVDRRALPGLSGERPGLAEDYEAPQTPTEEVLARIWAEILGLERVGVHDDFFELGGHSLLATRMLARAADAFAMELPVRRLFAAPTVAALARHIDAKRGTGEQRLAPPILPVERSGPLPLSFAQERLWFLDQLQPGNTAYNIPAAFALSGTVRAAVLERCLEEVARRHEGLRATFRLDPEGPRQVIAERLRVPLRSRDLRFTAAARRREELGRLAAEEAQRPFDLARGPLLRACLVRLSEAEQVLLLTVHHIVADGWSMGLLWRELEALHAAFAAGQPSPLPELPVQYADFACWQRQWLQGAVLESQLGYWRDRLAGAPGVLELPADRPRPAVQSMRGGALAMAWSAELSWRLEELARREGVTLFMVLLAGFQALLGRYSGQLDLVVGTPIANRTRAELEGLIGLFVNTLVVRTDLRGDPGFGELLGRLREVLLGAYSHQDLPFEKLVEELQPERSLSHQPLVQVMFVLQDDALSGPAARRARPAEAGASQPAPPAAEEGWAAGAATGTTKFDLTLGVAPTPWGLRGALEYATDLFDRPRMQRLLAHLEQLLGAAVAEPQRRLSELALLSPAERQQLLEWNDTVQDHGGRGGLLHELFAAQAARTPEATAVRCEEAQLSYGELARRARHTARRLRELGVGAESRVGLFVERSLEMMVALLGILEAGAAYVPLDPGYPAERLRFMLADSGVDVLLAQQRLAAAVPAPGPVRLLWLEPLAAGPAEPEEESADLPAAASATAQSPAYLIYTSGSTGRPKGVVNTHGAICNRLLWMQSAYRLEAADRVLQKTPLCFDVSVWELFWPLLTGACLVVARPGGHQDSAYLVELIAREGITTLHFVPSMLQVFLEERELSRCRSLRRVIASGEALSPELQERFFARLGAAVELHNLYGPTEAAVDVTCWPCQRPARAGRPLVPIGRPIANLQLTLLDRWLAPVPAGVPGELYLGGAGLARGYHQRPELTAERFVPAPAAATPGARLYRTGDLARWLDDGSLEFLGRLDHQIKIRGFRIELGEVEAALLRHPAVREAAAVAGPGPGGTRLVAYVVPRQGMTSLEAELRAALRSELPEPMVPAVVVVLAALPLTPSGKVDRRALPAPEPARRSPETPLAPPRSQVERELLAMWHEVLARDEIGIHDNFFDFGGHSLLAIQVVARVRRTFGLELPVRRLFELPTVAGLAERIAAERGEAPEAAADAPIVPVARTGSSPLSFSQERLWFLEQLQPGTALYNVPAAFHLSGWLRPEVLKRCLDEVVRRHEVLRTTFAAKHGRPVQVIARELKVPLPVDDLRPLPSFPSGLRVAEAQRLAEHEARIPFDLSRGPLLRARLLRLDHANHLLLLTLHHIVSDAWSLRLLYKELTVLYEAFALGRPSPLPELPIQYADYATWQRRWLQGAVLEEQLAFWRRELAGVPAALDLPADRPRPPLPTTQGSNWYFVLSGELANALREVCRREGVTPFMVALTAFFALLHRYTGQRAMTVGSPVANRGRTELEGLIGFFVNTLALRGDLAGDPDFATLLARVRETALAAFAHQDLPFERLVEELQPQRDLSRHPLFQVMLVFQHPGQPARSAAAPTSSPPASPRAAFAQGSTGTAKFDLTLFLAETENAIACTLEYSSDLFDLARMARLAGHLEALLRAVTGTTGVPISTLPLLTREERQQLLLEWNDVPGSPAGEQRLEELFAAQAARTPDAVAVAAGRQALTYRELARRAEQVARRLRQLGVGPESRVGICTERSLEQMAAVLGVLSAGGACVPLDPAYPAERLAFMVSDADVAAVLVQERLAGALPALSAPLFVLDRREEEAAGARGEGPAPAAVRSSGASCDGLAYVIYTSGSTGRPKGVAMPHRPICRMLAWQIARSALPVGARTLQFASLSFDVSFQEMFATWGAGGTLVLCEEEARRDGSRLARQLAEERVERLFLPAVALQQLALAAGAARPDLALREVITAGEPLRVTLAVAAFFARLHGATLYNQYGPTESHVITELPLRGEASGWPAAPAIGRPIPGARIRVLDHALQPVPVGVPGELYLSGDTLARGYLARPELTAERFLPEPGCGEPGARMYRSGDLARLLPGGDLEFLGRSDDQVKVRGFRIELGEVESCLSRHPEVGECAVTAHADSSGSLRLVAYLVPCEGCDPTPFELAAFLRRELPEPMIPSFFLRLAALPRTPSGKLARRELPAPTPARADLETLYRGPRGPLEETVVSIFREVLGVDRVGADDDFFALGGHSLLATQAVSRLREAVEVELPLRLLFELPTPAQLALGIVHHQLAELTPAERQTAAGKLSELTGLSEEEAVAALCRVEAA